MVVAHPADMHTDLLCRYLTEHDYEFTRIWYGLLSLSATISLSTKNGSKWVGTVRIMPTGRKLDLSTISAVWWRRPGEVRFLPEASDDAVAFTRSELHHTLESAWSLLDCYWMNHPVAIQAASYKFEQLERAKQFGFRIPDTIITTSVDEARTFIARQHEHLAIYKVLTASLAALDSNALHSPRPPTFALPSRLISEHDLRELTTLGPAPCQFQAFLPKRREYRVTVIGNQAYVITMEPSPEDAAASADWRHLSYSAPMRPTLLPGALAPQCVAYVHSYGLRLATLDFLETDDGCIYFIDHNPSGQFLFIQRRLPEMHLLENAVRELTGCEG